MRNKVDRPSGLGLSVLGVFVVRSSGSIEAKRENRTVEIRSIVSVQPLGCIEVCRIRGAVTIGKPVILENRIECL